MVKAWAISRQAEISDLMEGYHYTFGRCSNDPKDHTDVTRVQIFAFRECLLLRINY